jgi:hypothetical protein
MASVDGFVPEVGQTVRFTGYCLRQLVGRTGTVTRVYEHDGEWWAEVQYFSYDFDQNVISAGRCKGMEQAEEDDDDGRYGLGCV